MNKQYIAERLFYNNGIDAVLVDDHFLVRGDHTLITKAILLASVTLAKAADTDIRAVVSGHTIVVENEGGVMVAIAFPQGHPIAKSVRRMIRRAFSAGAKHMKFTPPERSTEITTTPAPKLTEVTPS